jgi:hypothetical protein
VSEDSPLVARRVLRHCQLAVAKLERSTGNEWFVYWAASVSLLRTIGDVLQGVDKNDRALRGPRIVRWEESLTGDDGEMRELCLNLGNKLLHAYDLGIDEAKRSRALLATGSGEVLVTDGRVGLAVPGSSVPVSRKPFAGQDAAVSLRRACAWWDQQLGIIEASIAQATAEQR